MKFLSKLAAVLLSASVLSACSGTQSSVVPPFQTSQSPAVAQTASLPSTAKNGGAVSGGRMHTLECHTIIENGSEYVQCFPDFNSNPCVISCDGPPQNSDPCLKDPKLPQCGGSDPSTVACNGTPTQCAGIPCDSSKYTIGDYFTAPGGETAKVTDINSLQQFTNNESWNVGWIYQATVYPPGGSPVSEKFIMGDLTTQAGLNFSINLGLVSVGQSTGSYTPVKAYPGWPMPGAPNNMSVQRCESRGRVLA